MAIINPSINFNGNCEEAFNFYKGIFKGEFTKVSRFKDMATPEYPVSDHEADKIMYIALSIGHNVLIGNDVPEVMGKTNEQENRSKIAIFAETKEEAYALYDGLSQGGEVEVPMDESPWGSYFAMLRDKYGIEWMIDFDPKKNG